MAFSNEEKKSIRLPLLTSEASLEGFFKRYPVCPTIIKPHPLKSFEDYFEYETDNMNPAVKAFHLKFVQNDYRHWFNLYTSMNAGFRLSWLERNPTPTASQVKKDKLCFFSTGLVTVSGQVLQEQKKKSCKCFCSQFVTRYNNIIRGVTLDGIKIDGIHST
jgi:hypothetical protein